MSQPTSQSLPQPKAQISVTASPQPDPALSPTIVPPPGAVSYPSAPTLYLQGDLSTFLVIVAVTILARVLMSPSSSDK